MEHNVTPQEKAEWEYKTAVGVAAEIARIKLPDVVMTGGNGNNDGLLSSLIGAEIAKGMLPKEK